MSLDWNVTSMFEWFTSLQNVEWLGEGGCKNVKTRLKTDALANTYRRSHQLQYPKRTVNTFNNSVIFQLLLLQMITCQSSMTRHGSRLYFHIDGVIGGKRTISAYHFVRLSFQTFDCTLKFSLVKFNQKKLNKAFSSRDQLPKQVEAASQSICGTNKQKLIIEPP